MTRSEPKTQRTRASVAAFLASVADDARRKDAKTVARILREITGEKPAMWGPSIIGYGEYDIPTGKWPRVCFSPRKANLVVYLSPEAKDAALLRKLGKHKTGVSCLYINKLSDVDESVLRALIKRSWAHMKKKYPS